MSQLPVAPQAELRRLEDRIARGIAKLYQARRAFLAIGQALRRIRSRRLDKATHRTFEAYCRQRWGMGRSNANKLIAAADAVLGLGATAHRISARTARELLPFRGHPELQARIIKRAAHAAPSGRPTADLIARAAREVLEDLGETDSRHLVPLPTVNGEDGARASCVAKILLLLEKLRLLLDGLRPGAAAALTRLDQLAVAVHQLE
jgi:hypothetical protein